MEESQESLLAEKYREATAAWGAVTVSMARFRSALEATMVDEAVRLDELHTSDLYLALACLDRAPAALAAFERHVVDPIRPSVERVCRNGSISAEDVIQWTREKLLVGEPPKPPKLAQYTGRGSLVAWVRVVAMREALQEHRKSKRERVKDDVSLLDSGVPLAVNMELAVLRNRHAASFRAAVHEGLRRLAPEQRALLRMHTHDGLSIDEIAPMLKVHRATAARRLERARMDALAHTRSILRERHGLSESEALSLCMALGSEVDVSLGRALSDEAPR